jgi:uncharacterized membrane protein YqiK
VCYFQTLLLLLLLLLVVVVLLLLLLLLLLFAFIQGIDSYIALEQAIKARSGSRDIAILVL